MLVALAHWTADSQLSCCFPARRDSPALPLRPQRGVAGRGGPGGPGGGGGRALRVSEGSAPVLLLLLVEAPAACESPPPTFPLPFSPQSYGSEGLRLVERSEIVLSGQTVLQLTFDPGAFGHAPLTARCPLDHPFYVKGKGVKGGGANAEEEKEKGLTLRLAPPAGWTSFHPSLTVVHHGIPCHELDVGALCLPPGHRDAKHADDSLVCEKIRR